MGKLAYKGDNSLNDLRAQLPECPLEYQVPHIPGSHTALVIEINTADIDWQEQNVTVSALATGGQVSLHSTPPPR